ncbi:MAG TPA: isoprenylcysteine carboxylmethyltransferase family protein [bacterium]|nr:isoprenylcysteine carboxylmethyltransferase family protein [bacterium]
MKRAWLQGRADPIGEHPFGDLGQLVLLAIFLSVWIGDSFFLEYTTFVSEFIPDGVQIGLALMIFPVSGYFAAAGLHIVFGTEREQPEVIRKGVFGVVRHPIYLAAVLYYLGLLILSFSMLAFGVWIVILCFYQYLARYEERLLLKKFGEGYAAYMRQIPMWVPRIRTK